ncbi:MAG: glycosyltransferase family 39 protein [Capsulimonadaceae bacterium]|nr:glycosyltransferase family 39 protein [Capsulimonadaceae bacterium]
MRDAPSAQSTAFAGVQRIAAVAVLMMLVAIRTIGLGADPPSWLSWSAGLYTDEGMYAGDARSMALFGHWMRGDFHGAIVTPVLYILQLGVFRMCGAGLVQARAISVVAGLATVALLWLGMRRAYGERAAWIGALLLGIATPFVLYNRLALMETPVVCCLAAAFACLAIRGAGGRLVWVFAAGLLLALAVAIKPLALLILPAFAVYAGAGRTKDLGVLAGGLAVFGGAYWIVAVAPHVAALVRMNGYYAHHQYLPHSAAGVARNIKRALWTGRQDGLLRTMLSLWPMGTALGGLGIVSACKRRQPADLLLLCWLLVPAGFWVVTSYTPSRYYVLIMPALAGLAGVRLARASRLQMAILLTVAVLIDGVTLGTNLARPIYGERTAARALSGVVEPGSVIAGQFAPQLAWGTTLEAVYVQPGLANDDRPVERSRASYVLVTDSAYWNRYWDHAYPGLRDPVNRIGHVLIAGKYDEVLYTASPPAKWLARNAFSRAGLAKRRGV